MAIIKITKENFDAEITNSTGKVLLDFGAPWCVPCKKVEKVLEELTSEFPEIKIAKVDIEEYPDLGAKLGILSIPAIIYYKEGKLVKKLSGEQSKKALVKLISK